MLNKAGQGHNGSERSSERDPIARNQHEEILSRICEALGVSKDTELAKALGIAQSSVASARERKAVPHKWIVKLSVENGFSANWILFGEGSMMRGEVSVGQAGPLEQHAKAHPSDFVLVPKVAAELNAGTGSFITDEAVVGYFAFRKDWMTTIGAAAKMVLLEVTGDSMHPAIRAKDHVMLDTSQTNPRQGTIMAVGIDDRILIKRIGIQAGFIRLISDNKLYDPIDVKEPHQVRFLGRVVWLAREM